MKQLVLIPGLGDRHIIYQLTASLWRWFGFEVHIFIFNWNSDDATIFPKRMQALIQFLEQLPGEERYIIGVSAGGTAALNALAVWPDLITKVATLCAPLAPIDARRNQLLAASVAALERNSTKISRVSRANVLSVYGRYDQVVAPDKSKLPGIHLAHIPSAFHAVNIALGLTLLSRPIRRFFREVPY